jgi:hypothetical protein
MALAIRTSSSVYPADLNEGCKICTSRKNEFFNGKFFLKYSAVV